MEVLKSNYFHIKLWRFCIGMQLCSYCRLQCPSKTSFHHHFCFTYLNLDI